MARTAQTARQSRGGKAPRKQLAEGENVGKAKIKDHNGNDVALTWKRDDWYEDEYGTEDIPPFAFQVYILETAASSPQTVTDSHLPESLPRYFRISDGNCEHHWQVYLQPQPSILACVEHQRAELVHRNRNGLWPRMVPTWTDSSRPGYSGFIIVIDTLTWQTESLVVVDFDPTYPSADLDECDRLPLVSASRQWDVAGLGDMGKLRDYFMDAGHSWTIEDLRRRNNGGFSPALYPAVDPAAHQDADGDPGDINTLPPLEAATGDDANQDQGHSFDKNVLFRPAHDFGDIIISSYTDEAGFEVLSARLRQRKPTQHKFRIVLYLDQDCPAFAPQALFSCLNRGFIADEPWMLDVVRDQPSLSAAAAHHETECRRRGEERTAGRDKVVHMILAKIIADRLPTEIAEYIHDLLVPPALRDFSAHGSRLFRDFMLYLDSSRLDAGPLAVYTNPTTASLPRPTVDKSDMNPFSHQAEDASQVLIDVLADRSWDWLPDELQILHSLCSPRCPEPDLPRIHLRIEPAETLTGSTRSCSGSRIPISLKLEAKEPITVHYFPLFMPEGLWEGAVELYDLTLGVQVPFNPRKRLPPGQWSRFQSWAWAEDYYADSLPDGHLPGETFSFFQLNPGQWRRPARVSLESYGSFWYDRLWVPFAEQAERQSPLVHGHRYALRLRDGVTVPRWVWGPASQRRGPYNLPPISVVMDDEATFVYSDVTEQPAQGELPPLE